MSNPANILDRFRSHNYHHILIACDNSQAADRIASNDFEVSQFSQLGVRQDVLGDIIPVRDNENPGAGEREFLGNSVVLINGMRDSRYVIQNVEWESVTAANVNTSDNGNSLALEGKMTIQEPRGFEFMNIIDYVQDAFDTDATGVIFLLKTIFVGHIADDNTGSTRDDRPTIISDLRPLQFMLLDITATFDATGGAYQLKFVGLNNGASRLPQISRGAEMTTFTPTSRVLSQVFTEFAQKLNAKALQDYENVRNQVKEQIETGRNSTTNPEDVNNLRRVEYRIIPVDPYDDDDYVLDNFDPTIKEKDTEESVAAIHTGAKFTVEQVIQKIMMHCKRVQDELNKGVDGVRYRYKIRSSLEMKKEPQQSQGQENVTTDREVLLVTYYVERFVELNNTSVTALLTGQSSNDEIDEQQIRDNLITFEYIFTGQNVDIKNFDMKLNQGLLFLQTLRTTDNKYTQQEKAQNGTYTNKDTTQGSIGTKNTVAVDDDGNTIIQSTIRSRTPVFPGTTVKDVLTKNVGAPDEMTAFNSALQQHAALEQLETKLTIRGNPYLMSSTNRPSSESIDQDDTSSEEDRSVRVMKNWDRIPAIAQVNIRMPENSESVGGDRSPELVNFWYRGYYYVFSIKHKFSEGEFTQTLDMISMPQFNMFDPLETSPVNDTGDTTNNEPENANESKTITQRDRKEFRTGSRTARETVRRTTQPPPNQRRRKELRTGRE